jgi:hypothetical protein
MSEKFRDKHSAVILRDKHSAVIPAKAEIRNPAIL